MKMQDFFTRKRANEGVRLQLVDGTGNATDAWVIVRGFDSDAYRAAHDSLNRAMARLASVVRTKGADATLFAATQEEKDTEALAERAALVAAWSFEEPCTPAKVAEFLREAPYVSDQVYYFAQERDRFFETCSATSTAGQNTSSDSAEQPQQAAHAHLPTL